MIHAVGKLLIWKQRVRGCHEAYSSSRGSAGEPRLATAKCLTDPPRRLTTGHICWGRERKTGKENGENTNKTSVGLNGGICHAMSNDETLPGRRRLDSERVQHMDTICLSCRGEEVAIRRLLSDPLTSGMDKAIMGASGVKSLLATAGYICSICAVGSAPITSLLCTEDRLLPSSLSSWAVLSTVYPVCSGCTLFSVLIKF